MRAARGLGPRYWKLFSASAISNLGDGMSLIAYPWLASAVTRNPLLIGLVTAANRLPWLVFSLPAGVITDRVDRRRTMVACDLLRAGVHRRHRAGGVRRPGEPAEPWRAGLRDRHPHRSVRPVARLHPAARDGRGAARQLRADAHAGHRADEPAGARQQQDVERRARRQHLRRPAGRQPAPDRELRGALLLRRRVLRRGGRARVPHRRPLPRAHGRRATAVEGRAGRRRALAARSRAALADGRHPRHPERHRHDARRHARAVRAGGAPHLTAHVLAAVHRWGRRRCRRQPRRPAGEPRDRVWTLARADDGRWRDRARRSS